MYRTVATLLLAAHLGALVVPTLAKASASKDDAVAHCVPSVGHAETVVTQIPDECDACQMPDCMGMANCAHASVAIVSMPSIMFTAPAEIATVLEGSRDVTNPLRTPFPPPPKS